MTRTTLITIRWRDELPDAEVERLSRAWAAAVSLKPVVSEVRCQTPAPPADPGRPTRRRYQLTRCASHPPTGRFVHLRFPVRSPEDRWCYGCAATIPAGDPHAIDSNSGRICQPCLEAAIPETE